MDKYAILVAGGKGLRMGGDVPKQFVPIGGKPVLMRTIDAFRKADPQVRLILVLPASQQTYWTDLCKEYGFDAPCQLVDGGDTRFHSVRNGLGVVPEEADGVVAVHDGARPFVSPSTIIRCFDAAYTAGAVVPVTPVVETLRQVLPEGDSLTVDRANYRLVQTPQTFRIALLKEAYGQPYRSSFTDDASVVEELGHSVLLVEGDPANIKLTTPADLAYASYLCQE